MYPDGNHPFIKLRRKRIQRAVAEIRNRLRRGKPVRYFNPTRRRTKRSKMNSFDLVFQWAFYLWMFLALVSAVILGYL